VIDTEQPFVIDKDQASALKSLVIESLVIEPEKPSVIDPKEATLISPTFDALITQISSPFSEKVIPS
jgi:hypothetical protein